MSADDEQLTPPPDACTTSLESFPVITGGTWARETALDAAARVAAGNAVNAREWVGAESVLIDAEAFEEWLDRPVPDADPIMNRVADLASDPVLSEPGDRVVVVMRGDHRGERGHIVEMGIGQVGIRFDDRNDTYWVNLADVALEGDEAASRPCRCNEPTETAVDPRTPEQQTIYRLKRLANEMRWAAENHPGTTISIKVDVRHVVNYIDRLEYGE